MLGAIVSPAVETQINLKNIQDQVKKAQSNCDDLEQKWKDVFKTQAELSSQIQDQIISNMTAISQSVAQVNVEHDQYKKSYAQIQNLGIGMICFIFILLLMKQYDLFDTLNEIMLSPITYFTKK
jgi:DNA repair exonuclease SbcCD ATPase subunit